MILFDSEVLCGKQGCPPSESVHERTKRLLADLYMLCLGSGPEALKGFLLTHDPRCLASWREVYDIQTALQERVCRGAEKDGYCSTSQSLKRGASFSGNERLSEKAEVSVSVETGDPGIRVSTLRISVVMRGTAMYVVATRTPGM